MTQDEIICMAQEAGLPVDSSMGFPVALLNEISFMTFNKVLERLVALVAEATKEKAKRLVLDDAYALTFQTFWQYRTALAKEIGELK